MSYDLTKLMYSSFLANVELVLPKVRRSKPRDLYPLVVIIIFITFIPCQISGEDNS